MGTSNKTCKWRELSEDTMRGVAICVMNHVARIMVSGAIEDMIAFRINNCDVCCDGLAVLHKSHKPPQARDSTQRGCS